MTSSRDIKRRIKSVTSTQQITKAMKMVSAAKLRKSQAAVLAVRPFTRKIDSVILHVGQSAEHPYLAGRKQVKRVCYVVLGSDRGLCGGFNANLNRFLDHVLAAETRPFDLAVIGRKTKEHCQRRGYDIAANGIDIGDTPSFYQARQLSAKLMDRFDRGAVDEVWVVYSEFKSAMVQTPRCKRLLPMEQPQVQEGEEDLCANLEYIFEPDRASILSELLPQYMDINVYCSLQEAKASEHGARMTAMTSASDNAVEMIDRLTLSLNRARQAAITTEISEIVGGAAALA